MLKSQVTTQPKANAHGTEARGWDLNVREVKRLDHGALLLYGLNQRRKKEGAVGWDYKISGSDTVAPLNMAESVACSCDAVDSSITKLGACSEWHGFAEEIPMQ